MRRTYIIERGCSKEVLPFRVPIAAVSAVMKGSAISALQQATLQVSSRLLDEMG
jgi:hypothetical protein